MPASDHLQALANPTSREILEALQPRLAGIQVRPAAGAAHSAATPEADRSTGQQCQSAADSPEAIQALREELVRLNALVRKMTETLDKGLVRARSSSHTTSGVLAEQAAVGDLGLLGTASHSPTLPEIRFSPPVATRSPGVVLNRPPRLVVTSRRAAVGSHRIRVGYAG